MSMIVQPARFAVSGGGPVTTLTAGLAHWWDLGEASGTRSDAVGSMHLTPTGTVSQVSARNGSGASAALGAYLSRATSPDLASGDFTIAGVFRTSQANAGFISRQNPEGSATTRQFLVTLEGGVCYLSVSTNGSSNAAIVGAGSGLNDDSLHDFIAWRDTTAGTINLQVDGGTVQSAAFSGASSLYSSGATPLFLHSIGAVIYTGGSVLDSMGVWGRMLTPTERSDLRNGGAWRAFADL